MSQNKHGVPLDRQWTRPVCSFNRFPLPWVCVQWLLVSHIGSSRSWAAKTLRCVLIDILLVHSNHWVMVKISLTCKIPLLSIIFFSVSIVQSQPCNVWTCSLLWMNASFISFDIWKTRVVQCMFSSSLQPTKPEPHSYNSSKSTVVAHQPAIFALILSDPEYVRKRLIQTATQNKIIAYFLATLVTLPSSPTKQMFLRFFLYKCPPKPFPTLTVGQMQRFVDSPITIYCKQRNFSKFPNHLWSENSPEVSSYCSLPVLYLLSIILSKETPSSFITKKLFCALSLSGPLTATKRPAFACLVI